MKPNACAGETVAKGNDIRDQFYKAVYDQIQDNALQNGVAQGSNFWNLYTVGTGNNDPYQVTLADTSTMNVINAHVRAPAAPAASPPPACTRAYSCADLGLALVVVVP